MRKLIPLLVILIGAAGGVAAGMFLKPSPEPCVPADSDACLAAAAEEEAHDEHGPAPKHEDTEFAVLNRQFVIPIVREERVVALVVSSLALEVEAGTTEAVFALEPKLRDAFLQVLFIHAHSGGFDGTFTARQAMNDLKTRLVETAEPIVGTSLADVLITEIVRQDL